MQLSPKLLWFVVAGALVAGLSSACSAVDGSLGLGDDDLRKAPSCGGVAGLVCPSGLTCVDDPRDSCDRARGGRDCGGLCVKAERQERCGGVAGALCPFGSMCVDDPRDACDPAAGGQDCLGLCVRVVCSAPKAPNCPAGQRFDALRCTCAQACGGVGGLSCPAGKACVDAPGDDCDPTQGGRDCSGLCR